MHTVRVRGDRERYPNHITRVWGYMANTLRDIKDRTRRASEGFYGKGDRLTYLTTVHGAMKAACDFIKGTTTVTNYINAEDLQQISVQSTAKAKELQNAQDILSKFTNSLKITVGKIAEVKQIFEDDVLCPLEKYCSEFTKLGVPDDHFFHALQARAVSVRGTLQDFDRIVSSVRQAPAISATYFSDKEFSQEVSMEFDCEKYPILRIAPDLFQKVETVINIAQDWLRSDKVYLEELKRQIDKTHERIKEGQTRQDLVKHEYNRAFAKLKQTQAELDDTDDSYEMILKEITLLESKKTRMEMEISAVAKTLRNCRDHLRDLHSGELVHRSSCSLDIDEVDGEVPEEEMDFEPTRLRESPTRGHAHSSYRSRLCRDARCYSTKLDYLRKKKKRIEKKICQKKEVINEMENSETEVQVLSKRVKGLGRKKSKLYEEQEMLMAHLESLELAYQHRLHPETNTNSKKPPRSPSKTVTGHKKRKPKSRKRTRNSAELHRAFRVVKNSIGHNWKDLARALPYGSSKPLAEINNEIKVIEYENHGQLKEQAYQSLARWHAHAGRRASVASLKETLVELNETRIAEKLASIRDNSADTLSTGSASSV